LFLAGIFLWLFGIINLTGTDTGRGGGQIPLAGIIFPAGILLVLPSYIFLGLPLAKNLRLLADREAVQVTGIEQFVNALTKVGKLIPKLMVGKRPDSRYPYGRPGIKKRIELIQASSS
jgi:Zn-dependent protease with chaperone function